MNFTACGILFEHNATNFKLYSYHGPTPDLLGGQGRPTLITFQGCLILCGTGYQRYPWPTAAATITTWVLPLIGLILQAPFESNQFRSTLLATCRWLGSPIASLSYIFWNIRITGKCAIMVDMATKYNTFPDGNSEFRRMRDSFYILSVMNQFAINPSMEKVSAEKVLRIALFETDLRLPNPRKALPERRAKLALSLRAGRKRGVVPVFISTLWFILSLAISIQAGRFQDQFDFFDLQLMVPAFDNIGMNTTAHNLALGLLLSWMPVLTLSSIADRSPASTEETRRKLNHLLESVRVGLLTDPNPRWDSPTNHGEYFTDFCGQGRSRWHYGVAYPILAGIEDDFAARYGRGWLFHPDARAMLISRPKDTTSVLWFDFKEIFQILSAVMIVGGSVFGAFIISYFTPTTGLGCRSGGYIIYFILVLVVFSIESITWWTMPSKPFTQNVLRYFLNLFEMTNTSWLAYIIVAQTFGLYRTCACWSSNWASGGGYINFKTTTFFKNAEVQACWTGGTLLSCTVMGTSLLYIAAEWCSQGHLWTVDYEKAMTGLKWTRRFKKYTVWFRCAPDWLINQVGAHRPSFLGEKRGRRSLVWRWKLRG